MRFLAIFLCICLQAFGAQMKQPFGAHYAAAIGAGAIHSISVPELNDDLLLDDLEREFAESEINDPLINYNRAVHNFNFVIYDAILSPSLDTYNLAPNGIRQGIYNFFKNLSAPVRFLCELLSFRPRAALDELGAFALNSTAGLLGVFDIAGAHGLGGKDVDFSVTFGRWGIPSGSYIVLPFLGPSSVRDIAAMPLNALAHPIGYIKPAAAGIALATFSKGSGAAAHKAAFDAVRRGAVGDDYFLVRDAYIQLKENLIKGN